MKFKQWDKYLSIKESIKDDELNRILDKISKKQNITNREKDFLSRYDDILDSDMSDFSHQSKNNTFDKINDILSKGKKIICNLYDKNGKIDDEIISVETEFETDSCVINLKHGDTANLYDKFLYNIYYDIPSDSYSLTSQDEYYEKIPVKDDN